MSRKYACVDIVCSKGNRILILRSIKIVSKFLLSFFTSPLFGSVIFLFHKKVPKYVKVENVKFTKNYTDVTLQEKSAKVFKCFFCVDISSAKTNKVPKYKVLEDVTQKKSQKVVRFFQSL